MTYITAILAKAKTPVFWTVLISAIATFVYTILGIFDIVPAIEQTEIIEIGTVVLSFLTAIGVLNEHNIDTSTTETGEIEGE